MFINMIAMLSSAFLPFHHSALPVAAPVVIAVQAPVTHDVIAPASKPPAVEGPQPVGLTQTLAPLPNRCEITWQGTVTQSDGETATTSGSFSQPCDATWNAPAGVTYTSTPLPASDTATTGS
jgi:hypothetical protein